MCGPKSKESCSYYVMILTPVRFWNAISRRPMPIRLRVGAFLPQSMDVIPEIMLCSCGRGSNLDLLADLLHFILNHGMIGGKLSDPDEAALGFLPPVLLCIPPGGLRTPEDPKEQQTTRQQL